MFKDKHKVIFVTNHITLEKTIISRVESMYTGCLSRIYSVISDYVNRINAVFKHLLKLDSRHGR